MFFRVFDPGHFPIIHSYPSPRLHVPCKIELAGNFVCTYQAITYYYIEKPLSIALKAWLLWSVDQQWLVFPWSNLSLLVFHFNCGFYDVIHALSNAKFCGKTDGVDFRMIWAIFLLKGVGFGNARIKTLVLYYTSHWII